MLELINSRLLLSLPAALPNLESLSLTDSIVSSVSGVCNLCTTAEVSREDLIQFATMLKAPLRTLHIDPAPWMGDDDVDALLGVLGKDLEWLGLSNGDHLHQKHRRRINLDNEIPVSHRSLLAIAKHCSNLRHLSIFLQSSPNQRSDTLIWRNPSNWSLTQTRSYPTLLQSMVSIMKKGRGSSCLSGLGRRKDKADSSIVLVAATIESCIRVCYMLPK